VEALAAALRAGAASDVERRAHQLKGAVGNFALPDLVQILSTLSRRDTEKAAEGIPGLLSAGASAERQLRRALQQLEDQAVIRTAAQ
jgi:two-component system, OmpR family, sensor histidine kinase TorS